MVSREERGAFGTGSRIKDFSKYNPFGHKITPFLEEKVCALCESKCDVVFPMAPKLCQACSKRIWARQDVMRVAKPKLDMNGYRCDWCGGVSFFPTIINTRICHKCTNKLAKKTAENQYLMKVGARRIV